MMNRATAIAAMLVIGFSILVSRISILMKQGGFAETAVSQSQYTVTAGSADGGIYDRNFTPLVNGETAYYAVTYPGAEAIRELLPHLAETLPLVEGVKENRPFVCRVDTKNFACEDILVLEVPVRYTEQPLAQHVLGYTSDGSGVTGLEGDYNKVLRSSKDTAGVTYTVDAAGQVLAGIAPQISPIAQKNAGVVTTLDAQIQQICEEAGAGLDKGAIVVMEVDTGDVLAMASFPSYTPDTLAQTLENENSPLINRCLYTYSVGSIFKLVTAGAAYAQGITDFTTECSGRTEIAGQVFRCHDHEGHGPVDMKQAMIYSCNTYFVELSRQLDPQIMRQTAQDLGFGTQIALSSSIVSAGGTLPTMTDLEMPAEMANFSFGQGLLTASPLQITQMTCGIANNGDMPLARLILGYTTDGRTIENTKTPMYAKSLPRNAAYYLQNLMIAAINENADSNAVPDSVYAAAKTSTAQTGRYDEEGVEYCHAWITGYFPIEEPKYAVTVLAEDGGYGNDAAAPLFREITERITEVYGAQTIQPDVEKISEND